MDIFLIYGLIIVLILSLLIYLVDTIINRKKKDKKKYSFIRRYPIILLILLLILLIVYLMKVSAFLRITYGVIILSLPLAGLLYYIRSLDNNIIKKKFIYTFFAVLITAVGTVTVLSVYMYYSDYQNILEAKNPTFAMKNGIFAYERPSCGTDFYDGLFYRVEYCSTNTANKDNYRIRYWFDSKWKYEIPNNQDDNKWCKCGN